MVQSLVKVLSDGLGDATRLVITSLFGLFQQLRSILGTFHSVDGRNSPTPRKEMGNKRKKQLKKQIIYT